MAEEGTARSSENRIPRGWVGRRVEALIISPWGKTESQFGAPTDRSLTAWPEVGLLEDVTQLGIVASFEQEDAPGETAVSAFYPWSAVLRLRLQE
jgi:hypothetical protein